MVSKSTNKRKTIKKQQRILYFATLIILIVIIIIGGVYIINYLKSKEITPSPITTEQTNETSKKTEKKEEKIKSINFQPIIDEWANSVGGNKSIVIYDLDRNEIAGSYNTKEEYRTASLYKLFVVYEGYRRVQRNEWDKNATVGATGHTVLECLDLAIRESYSPCAETLWYMIGQAELDSIIVSDFGIKNSDISHLISNTEDILEIMKIFYEHTEITDQDLINQMKDSFLNQPITAYNWRQGLPSGFSKANVYNKVGWEYNPDKKYWEIYHDAAIIEMPEINRHFIVVVMTNYIDYNKIKQFGKMIEQQLYQ